MDSNYHNDVIKAQLNLTTGEYKFSIQYAARSRAVSTSAFSVSWNGQQVAYVQAVDELIRTLEVIVYSDGGLNVL